MFEHITKTSMKKTTKTQTTAQAAPPNEATIDWTQYQGESGFEHVQQSDLGIPMLVVLQAKSAECDRTHKDYATKKIEGAEAGDIIHSVSRRILHKYNSAPIIVVPAAFEKVYNEWKPNRQGFVRAHRNAAIVNEVTGKDQKGNDVLRNGNLLIETAMFYVLVLEEGQEEPQQAVIPLQSTGLRASRKWLNMATNIRLGPNKINPPLFSHSYKITTVISQNEDGSWYTPNVELNGMVQDRKIVAISQGVTKRVSLLINQAKGLLTNAPDAAHDEVPM